MITSILWVFSIILLLVGAIMFFLRFGAEELELIDPEPVLRNTPSGPDKGLINVPRKKIAGLFTAAGILGIALLFVFA